MTIPDYQSIMLPLLEYIVDSKEYSLREAIDGLAQVWRLSGEERKELLPSGRQSVFDNRVSWARTYMKKAGLIEYTKRGYFKITQMGLEVLARKPDAIGVKYLEQFPDFVEFRNASRTTEDVSEAVQQAQLTPEESLETIYQSIRDSLSQDLLAKVKSMSPDFFERLVVDLLVRMGYGGSMRDAGQAIGRTGDGGIDGIIKEDKLGLDVIYIQAKRWDNVVGRPEIQKFAGALQGQQARKGVFITTSAFTKEASEFAVRIGSRIILIDGKQLAQLMIDNDVGVSKTASYDVKKVDLDYFADE